MKRRTLAWVLVVAMLIALFPAAVFADSETATQNLIMPEKVTYKAGETFEVALRMEASAGLSGYDGNITYDSTRLELVGDPVYTAPNAAMEMMMATDHSTAGFISVGSMVYSVIRVLASKPLGKYADRHTFTKMLNFCFAAALIAFLAGAFTVPENGAPLYVLYNVFYGIGMAGINSGNINLIYEHVSKEKRVCALALKDGIVGLVGFGTTLAASRLVEYIQQNGNHLFGIPLYAQQVTSALGAAVIAAILLYLNTAIRRL